jgi:hypothetical protein
MSHHLREWRSFSTSPSPRCGSSYENITPCSLLDDRGEGGERISMTHQLKRKLTWCRTVLDQHNGRSIYKPVETTYLHGESKGYGWDAEREPRVPSTRFFIRRQPRTTHNMEGSTCGTPGNRRPQATQRRRPRREMRSHDRRHSNPPPCGRRR